MIPINEVPTSIFPTGPRLYPASCYFNYFTSLFLKTCLKLFKGEFVSTLFKQTILLRETRCGLRYVVDAMVTNEAVPLCNSFHVTTRYCLLRRSATVSHLIITSEVVYDRPVFFGAKSIIESTCRSNLTDNFTDLVDHLAGAVAQLSDSDRVTGGSLAAPRRSLVSRAQPSTAGGGGVAGRREGVGIPSASMPSPLGPTAPGVAQTPRGISIPQVLLYPNQQSDRKWFLIVAV